MCRQVNTTHVSVYSYTTTSSGRGYYGGSKGGSQVTKYKEQESPHMEEGGVDGWVKQTQDLETAAETV